jgi:hypothetical protein
MIGTPAVPSPRVPEAPFVPEMGTSTVPQRFGKALLGCIQEPDVRSAFYATSVTSPLNVEDFVAECRARRAARPQALVPPSPPAITPLPASLEPQANALLVADQFKMNYEPFGAQLAVVPLADLVAPQWWVDAEYVETLSSSAPPEEDHEGMFRFSFPTGSLDRPMHLGTNGAAFVSARGDIGVPSPLRIAHYSSEKVTFEFDVTPRPNWVWLAACQDINRLLILNGTHHLLALMKAGRQHAYCLLGPVQSLGDLHGVILNFQDPGLFKPNALKAARPPLLRDFLDPQQAADVGLHLRQSYLRLAVQVDPGVIPRVE